MKGLVISWYFPPINSSEGLVTFKLLKNSKFEYDVFTQSADKTWSYDTNETKLSSSNVTNLNIGDKWMSYVDWIEKGVEYFKNNSEKYDFIMSRSMPPESHAIAFRIKEMYPNKLWIASFGDPIANNPYSDLHKVKSPYSIKGQQFEYIPIRTLVSPIRIIKNAVWKLRNYRYTRKYDTRQKYNEIENKTILNADVLIFNNKYQLEHMLKNYDDSIKNKAVIIPHTFDKDFYNQTEIKEKSDVITIRHLGHLDETRTPISFLKAVKRLKENYTDIEKRLLIEFYGDVCDSDKLYIMDNELCDIVKVKKPVKYFDSLKLMQESDLLLLVDANLSTVINRNIFFAAKISDYIGSGTNIFGITMTDGPSADILKETNGIQSSYSADEIYMKLKKILDTHSIPEPKNADHYDIKNVVKLYDDIVEEKVKGQVK